MLGLEQVAGLGTLLSAMDTHMKPEPACSGVQPHRMPGFCFCPRPKFPHQHQILSSLSKILCGSVSEVNW